MNYLPTSDFIGNALYFSIDTLAYNLFALFKNSFEDKWKRHTVQTIHYKFHSIAAKLVYHARQTILKVDKYCLKTINVYFET